MKIAKLMITVVLTIRRERKDEMLNKYKSRGEL
jgi:hypothetical protein